MAIIFIILKIILMVFVIKILMAQAYNFMFIFFKKPYLYLIICFLFNIIIFQILNYFYSQSTEQYIFNLYGFSSLVAIFLLFPPKVTIMEGEDLNELCDNLTGIKNSRLLYRIGLFLFFIGSIMGGYLIIYQEHILIISGRISN